MTELNWRVSGFKADWKLGELTANRDCAQPGAPLCCFHSAELLCRKCDVREKRTPRNIKPVRMPDVADLRYRIPPLPYSRQRNADWLELDRSKAKVDTVAADHYADIQQLNSEVSLASQNPDLEADAKKVLADKQAELDKNIKALVATHGDTAYAWQALLIQARQQADANDFKSASATLKKALDIDLQDAGLKALTMLRYAQVQLAAGDAKRRASDAQPRVARGF